MIDQFQSIIAAMVAKGLVKEATALTLTLAKESPDQHRKRTGKCPKGYRFDQKRDRCEPSKETKRKAGEESWKRQEEANEKRERDLVKQIKQDPMAELRLLKDADPEKYKRVLKNLGL